MTANVEHIVIGAGISGLGMAHYAARRGVVTLVLESADRVGGCVNSQTFPDCGDFWTEAGSHTCYNSYGHLLEILSDLDLLERLTPKEKLRYRLWRDGERKSVFSALHTLELIRSFPRLLTAAKAGKSVSEYYGGGLGRKNYRELLGPAFRAVICQTPDDFPADLLFRRKSRRKEIARSFTLPGGLADIPQAIAGQDQIEIRTEQAVATVSRDGNGFRARMADGTELTSRYVTLAVPPAAAASLIPDGMDELRNLIEGIGASQIETVALCVRSGDVEHFPPLAGLISIDDAFYSMVSRDYLPDRHFRGFAFHFPAGLLDADAQVGCVCRSLNIAAEQLAGLSWVSNRLPALNAGHADLVARMDGLLAGNRLAITGNWFLGVSLEDCLTRSHEEYLRLFPA